MRKFYRSTNVNVDRRKKKKSCCGLYQCLPGHNSVEYQPTSIGIGFFFKRILKYASRFILFLKQKLQFNLLGDTVTLKFFS